MRPQPPQVLMGMAGVLMMQVAPELQTPFAQQNIGSVAGILAMLAQDFDRAAARLAEENEAMVALFRRASTAVPTRPLQSRIVQEIAANPNADIHVSKLQAENDRLRRLLVEVHALVEPLPGAEAAAINEEIWDELRESTRRRHIMFG